MRQVISKDVTKVDEKSKDTIFLDYSKPSQSRQMRCEFCPDLTTFRLPSLYRGIATARRLYPSLNYTALFQSETPDQLHFFCPLSRGATFFSPPINVAFVHFCGDASLRRQYPTNSRSI